MGVCGRRRQRRGGGRGGQRAPRPPQPCRSPPLARRIRQAHLACRTQCACCPAGCCCRRALSWQTWAAAGRGLAAGPEKGSGEGRTSKCWAGAGAGGGGDGQAAGEMGRQRPQADAGTARRTLPPPRDPAPCSNQPGSVPPPKLEEPLVASLPRHPKSASLMREMTTGNKNTEHETAASQAAPKVGQLDVRDVALPHQQQVVELHVAVHHAAAAGGGSTGALVGRWVHTFVGCVVAAHHAAAVEEGQHSRGGSAVLEPRRARC